MIIDGNLTLHKGIKITKGIQIPEMVTVNLQDFFCPLKAKRTAMYHICINKIYYSNTTSKNREMEIYCSRFLHYIWSSIILCKGKLSMLKMHIVNPRATTGKK